MYSKKKMLVDSDVALSLRKEMEEEYKTATGRNWNASVARFQDRKVGKREGREGRGGRKG